MNYYDFLLPDLELASGELGDSIGVLNSKKILITGGTGLFGQWLLYFLIYLNTKHLMQMDLFCLSRDSNTFLLKHPFIKAQAFIRWEKVDISHEFNLDFSPDFVFHMAADVPVSTASNSSKSFDSTVNGTKNLLSFLSKKSNKIKLLLTSSGAVYGNQPATISHLEETFDFLEKIQNSENYYAKAKRISEQLIIDQAETQPNLEIITARCFAFSGPFLPLNKNYAIGNFVNNLTQNTDILVLGNGQARRSYMYGADLAMWLVMLLIEGKSGETYNVGSDVAISIRELAEKIACLNPLIKVEIKKEILASDILEQYVPSIEKAKRDLGLKLNFSLDYGIEKMIAFNSHFKTMEK